MRIKQQHISQSRRSIRYTNNVRIRKAIKLCPRQKVVILRLTFPYRTNKGCQNGREYKERLEPYMPSYRVRHNRYCRRHENDPEKEARPQRTTRFPRPSINQGIKRRYEFIRCTTDTYDATIDNQTSRVSNCT